MSSNHLMTNQFQWYVLVEEFRHLGTWSVILKKINQNKHSTFKKKSTNIYQQLFHKVFCLGKKFFWEVIFQLYYLLEYKIFISVEEKNINSCYLVLHGSFTLTWINQTNIKQKIYKLSYAPVNPPRVKGYYDPVSTRYLRNNNKRSNDSTESVEDTPDKPLHIQSYS